MKNILILPRVKKHFITFFCLCFSKIIFAQDLPSFDDNVIDNTPAAPIDNSVYVLLFVALIYGLHKLKKPSKNSI